MLEEAELREATTDDARTIASIVRRSFRRQVDILNLRRLEWPEYVGFETADRVRHRMQRGSHVLVADLAGQLIGTVSFCWAAPDSPKGEIARLAVLPAYRGTGLGRVLMGAAEAALGQVGVEVVEISIVATFHRLQSYYRPWDIRQRAYRVLMLSHLKCCLWRSEFLRVRAA